MEILGYIVIVVFVIGLAFELGKGHGRKQQWMEDQREAREKERRGSGD